MTESTISLAARLAANLFVDAINLAKPGVRLAAKVTNRLLGGSPFNEREAQRFLTMGGAEGKCGVCGSFGYCYMPDRCPKAAEQLADAEAERDVYEPDPLWAAENRRQENVFASGGQTYETGPRPKLSVPRPNTSAPGLASPVEVESPSAAHPPAAAEGSPTSLTDRVATGREARGPGDTGRSTSDSPGEQPVSVGVVTGPGADGSLGRAEHPQYREIQDRADAAIVADVLDSHRRYEFGFCGMSYRCTCSTESAVVAFRDQKGWHAHVAPLIVQALQK